LARGKITLLICGCGLCFSVVGFLSVVCFSRAVESWRDYMPSKKSLTSDAAIVDLLRKIAKTSPRDQAAQLTLAAQRLGALSRLDAESSAVEATIVLRTNFTGTGPYVGWKGLGLALREALDERDHLQYIVRNFPTLPNATRAAAKAPRPSAKKTKKLASQPKKQTRRPTLAGA
jgi:hypothetical protein